MVKKCDENFFNRFWNKSHAPPPSYNRFEQGWEILLKVYYTQKDVVHGYSRFREPTWAPDLQEISCGRRSSSWLLTKKIILLLSCSLTSRFQRELYAAILYYAQLLSVDQFALATIFNKKKWSNSKVNIHIMTWNITWVFKYLIRGRVWNLTSYTLPRGL